MWKKVKRIERGSSIGLWFQMPIASNEIWWWLWTNEKWNCMLERTILRISGIKSTRVYLNWKVETFKLEFYFPCSNYLRFV